MRKSLLYCTPEIALNEMEEELLICVSGNGANEGYEEDQLIW